MLPVQLEMGGYSEEPQHSRSVPLRRWTVVQVGTKVVRKEVRVLCVISTLRAACTHQPPLNVPDVQLEADLPELLEEQTAT